MQCRPSLSFGTKVKLCEEGMEIIVGGVRKREPESIFKLSLFTDLNPQLHDFTPLIISWHLL